MAKAKKAVKKIAKKEGTIPATKLPVKKKKQQLSKAEDLFTKAPVYSKFDNRVNYYTDNFISGFPINTPLGQSVQHYKEKIDAFCTKCNKDRIFSPSQSSRTTDNVATHGKQIVENNLPEFIKIFECSKNKMHKLFYVFMLDHDEDCLIKIGEYPSKYDMVSENLGKYNKIIDPNKVKELSKAAQLESYGYPIASFLYYRRVFEHIIQKSFDETQIIDKINEDEFRFKRMDEKVQYLKDYLPEYLQQNASMYKVLSKGVHQLEEKECSKYLDVIRTILFFAMDEALDKKKKEIRKKEVADQLKRINSEI